MTSVGAEGVMQIMDPQLVTIVSVGFIFAVIAAGATGRQVTFCPVPDLEETL